jgi:hypothetical protein
VPQWVADGHIVVIGHEGQQEAFIPQEGEEEEDLESTACKGDGATTQEEVTGRWGTMVKMSMRSMSDSQLRKKYMGLCRWESTLRRRIMSLLPERATRNMNMMMEKRIRCSSEWVKRPRRMKWEMRVWLPIQAMVPAQNAPQESLRSGRRGFTKFSVIIM